MDAGLADGVRISKIQNIVACARQKQCLLNKSCMIDWSSISNVHERLHRLENPR